MQYEVTIGIPLYQAVDYIEKTMLSALNQTFSNIEYLIIDDCGEDGSMSVVENLKRTHPRGNNIRIIHHQTNQGVGATRNHILDEAKGHYIFFLDSDDLLEPYTIQLLLDKMHKYQADVVYGSLDRIDKVGGLSVSPTILPDLCLFSENELALYAFKNYSAFPISVCNRLMDLSFLRRNKLRFIDTFFWEDLAFTYEMVMKVKRAVTISAITYHYICRPGSLSHYQDQDLLQKNDVLKNICTINYLKDKCTALSDKPYLSYLCYNLEMNSFYIVCHILKHKMQIVPVFTPMELQDTVRHPLSLRSILFFPYKRMQNIFLYLLGHMPLILFTPSIWLIGKLKKAI